MLDSGDDEPRKLAKGDPTGRLEAGVLAELSSSSPKRLLIADMAGLRPAIASGVSKSDGINGAEKRSPKPKGFDRRLESPKLLA